MFQVHVVASMFIAGHLSAADRFCHSQDCLLGVSRSRTNSLAGPSTSSAPSLESSLLGIHQCLAGIHAGGRADSKTLWKEASKLKEESTKKIKEENAVSKESMSMKVEAGMKYLEAGIHTSNKIR